MNARESLAEFLARVKAAGAAADVGFEDVLRVAFCGVVFIFVVGGWFLVFGEEEEEVLIDCAAEGFEKHFCGCPCGGFCWVEGFCYKVLEHEGLAFFVLHFVEFEHGGETQREVGAEEELVEFDHGGADAVVVIYGDDVLALLGDGFLSVGDAVGIGLVHE